MYFSLQAFQEGGGGVRLPAGFPADPLPWWRHWVWHGNSPHLQDQGGVLRQDHELLGTYSVVPSPKVWLCIGLKHDYHNRGLAAILIWLFLNTY